MKVRLLLVLLATVSIASCGDGKNAGRACSPGKLCINAGNFADPATLDPSKATGTWEDNVISDLFVGLVTDDAAGEAIPGVAQSWTVSPDGLTWTFKLRRSSWSDGQPVTAADFVFALQRLQDPATASEYAYLLYVLKGAQAINGGKAKPETLGVRALDPYTLEIKLEHPAPYLPELLKHQTAYPVPSHVVKKLGENWVRPGSMVSNGPFTLKSWTVGDRIELVKNPRFYDAANVCLDEVRFYPISDNNSAERQVARGELDTNINIRSQRIAYLRQPGRMPEYVKTHTYLGNSYFAFNTNLPKFRDKRVRDALSMAMDRDFIANKLLRAGEVPAYGFVPPGIANYPGGVKTYWADWPLERRQAEARRLLAAAGYGPKNPLRVKITHRGVENLVQFPAVQADWKAIGVQTDIEGMESQVAYAAYRQRDFEIADVGWIADFNDAMNFLELFRSTTGAQNYADYRNPAFDALLAKADHERDGAVRARILMQAEDMLMKDAAFAPLVFIVTKNLVAPDITGFVDNITDHHRHRWMCFSDVAKRRRG